MSIKHEITILFVSNTKISQTALLIPILWLAILPTTALGTHAMQAYSRPEIILPNLNITLALVETMPTSDQQVELEKKKFKLSLIVSIILIVVFFLAILLMTIIRMGRFYRKRIGLGDKNKPTTDIDAWTNYRIKDDLDKKD